MGVNERNHHLSGPSSSAAKNPDADFKIAFARRSSRFSDSNSPILARSARRRRGHRAVVDVSPPDPLAHRLDAETQLVPHPAHRPVIGAQLGAQHPHQPHRLRLLHLAIATRRRPTC